jgi:hypothetical protein
VIQALIGHQSTQNRLWLCIQNQLIQQKWDGMSRGILTGHVKMVALVVHIRNRIVTRVIPIANHSIGRHVKTMLVILMLYMTRSLITFALIEEEFITPA